MGEMILGQNYRVSFVIWDHTMLLVTRHKQTPRLNPSQWRLVLDLPTPDGWKAELTEVTWCCPGRESNPQQLCRKSDALTAMPPRHPVSMLVFLFFSKLWQLLADKLEYILCTCMNLIWLGWLNVVTRWPGWLGQVRRNLLSRLLCVLRVRPSCIRRMLSGFSHIVICPSNSTSGATLWYDLWLIDCSLCLFVFIGAVEQLIFLVALMHAINCFKAWFRKVEQLKRVSVLVDLFAV